MMNLCDNGHDEICYQGRACPLCDAIDTIKDLQQKITDLENAKPDLIAEGRQDAISECIDACRVARRLSV